MPDFSPGDPEYQDELESVRAKTGLTESVQVGVADVGGSPAVLIIGDFDFLAGSVGRITCQMVIATLDRAIAESLPVFASPTSGGIRMQEGTRAFLLMADVANAVTRLRAAGLLLAVWLRHPTTGGVMATWGSLGTVTFGEPGALAGFLGPRVYEMLEGQPFPPGVQQTDNLADHGVIDGVLPLVDVRRVVSRLVSATRAATREVAVVAKTRELPATSGASDAEAVRPAWDNVVATRDPARPGCRELIAANMTEVVTLSGTGEGQLSPAIALKIGRWQGRSVTVIAQDRVAQADGALIGPAALKTARRGLRIAAELNLPLVTIVDTPGAELSVEAEEGGLAGQIARCLAELMAVPVPTVSVLVGMGCGAGAIALLPADTVVAAELSWVSPLPLEGASVIRHRTPDRAAEMAEQQRVTAGFMAADGFVDVLVAEESAATGSAQSGRLVEEIGDAVATALTDLTNLDQSDRELRRRRRYSGGLV